eukprot:352743-Chlamydomonas_euryale.AAC.10
MFFRDTVGFDVLSKKLIKGQVDAGSRAVRVKHSSPAEGSGDNASDATFLSDTFRFGGGSVAQFQIEVLGLGAKDATALHNTMGCSIQVSMLWYGIYNVG